MTKAKDATAALFLVGENRFLSQISGRIRKRDPGAASAVGRVERQLPDGRNPISTQKSNVQTLILVVMKSLLEHTRLQDMKRFQRLDRLQVPQQGGKFNLHENGDRNAIVPGCHIIPPAQSRALNMLVKKSRK